MDSLSDRSHVKPELSAPQHRLSRPRAQPQRRYQLPRAPLGSWFLTWMREVHFWLYDHPLGRQRGRVLAVGVDWSLELYCNTQQLVRKSSTEFYSTAARHTRPPGSYRDRTQTQRCKLHSRRHTQSTRLTDATYSQQKSLPLPLQNGRILGEFLLQHFKRWNKFLIHPQSCPVILPTLKCQRHCSDFKLILNPSCHEEKQCPREPLQREGRWQH